MPAAASSSPTSACAPWAPTASRSRPTGFKDGKIVGTKRLFADGKFGAKDGKAHVHGRRSGAACRRRASRQQKDKFTFLINNGRTNHVWQNAYLDQENEFVMDRWPYPFIEMNPDDMTELGAEGGRPRRGLQRQRLDPGDGLSDADGQAEARPSCCSPIPTGVQGNVVSKGVNEFIIPNYKQTWGNIRKIADAPEGVKAPDLQVARNTASARLKRALRNLPARRLDPSGAVVPESGRRPQSV